jgi:hypothetical protein
MQLEREKADAVAREDYDRAKHIKKELDYLRGNAQNAAVNGGQQQRQQQSQYQQQPPPRGHPQDERPLGRNTSQKQFPAHASGAPFPPQQQQQQHPSHHPHVSDTRQLHADDAYAAHRAYEQHHGGGPEYDESQHAHEMHHNIDPHTHHQSPPADEEEGLGAGMPPPQQQQHNLSAADDGRLGDDRPIRPSRSSLAPAVMDEDAPSAAPAGNRRGAAAAAAAHSEYDPPEDDGAPYSSGGQCPSMRVALPLLLSSSPPSLLHLIL